MTKDRGGDASSKAELEVSRRITRTNPQCEGQRYLRTVLDSFELTGPDGTHLGLVYEPMRESISTFQMRMLDDKIPGYFLRLLLQKVLRGIDCLHNQCNIIHTGTHVLCLSGLADAHRITADLKPDNILLGLESPAAIAEMVKGEAQEPSPFKLQDGRAIYPSRNFGDLNRAPGLPKIADFGLAVSGDGSSLHTHPIQPDLFQAPEVILQAGWTYSVDIWNIGVMVSIQSLLYGSLMSSSNAPLPTVVGSFGERNPFRRHRSGQWPIQR